ncbi:hypothetical protein BSR28_02020 [Boudabousia liubingyangii]|uniref:dihydroxyacetone kinase phosphoryl donor subunit DhaM n=1 Tax=Boudabousia liubingyangii TaxID=1921764 RepID=UPI00093959AE|nr:dihydroxyacetone kinase phosphoryl donor subunit DhaM [Boudabousia liubingyangii]OKL48493.1 hypothetical protein BSR28_02020 [Boudabousia liubingyangii]
MIGIVVVSHSHALAEAAIDLVGQMLPDANVPLINAAGADGGTDFGTDAAVISEAITEADQGDGVLVMIDLGSAVMSTEMALEFVDPDVASRVRVSAAPLVEGLTGAAVRAAGGADLKAVAAAAEAAYQGKRSEVSSLGEYAAEIPDSGNAEKGPESTDTDLSKATGAEARTGDPETDGQSENIIDLRILDQVGLHARPAALLAAALGGFDSDIEAYVYPTLEAAQSGQEAEAGPVDAQSMMMLVSLGAKYEQILRLVVSDPAEAPEVFKAAVECNPGAFERA